MEATTLLQGEQPMADAQVAYVTRRTESIRGLIAEVLATHKRWVAAAAAESESRAAERQEWAAAVTTARDELETVEGTSSLAEIDAIMEQLRLDAADDTA
jgi:pyruvoyl-dependent arginine decarboxylase (PvlArgDC)